MMAATVFAYALTENPGLNLTLPEYMKQNKMTRKTASFTIV